MRVLRRTVLVSVVVVVFLALAGLPLYVYPATAGKPHKADAIVVLGGLQDGREYYALSLAQQGFAPTVFVSNPYNSPTAYIRSVCDKPHGVEVICFDPSPRTTRGEARSVRQEAARRGWKSILVVTNTPHVVRAGYIVGRCFSGQVTMLDFRTHLSVPYRAWMYAYQTAGFVRAWLQGGC
ncbi:YdcF family protein [uncultured Williamsia sp.]|uniref:YdcF family protein n=1 Tax=uncultured Williamsia sp. TaxID=259311 RepID=UPI0026200700|nr:YdcF family protein [uncultured Williamsia sp.]